MRAACLSLQQLARLNENLENATVETPIDINEEVRRILKRKSAIGSSGQQHEHQHQHQHQHQQQFEQQQKHQTKHQQQPQQPKYQHQQLAHECARTPQKPLKSPRGQNVIETIQSQPNPISKFPSTHQMRPTSRLRSPSLVPDVMLLDEQRPANPLEKPIGFRPPWMCQV
jgi:hypothetical protein